jgi:WD40 repeat protein
MHTAAVNGAAFSPDGRFVATASDDHTALVWEWQSDRPPLELEHNARVVQVVFSPDGGHVATVTYDGGEHARIWEWPQQPSDLPRGSYFSVHESKWSFSTRDVAFSSDGRLLVTASWRANSLIRNDTEARVWGTREFGPPLLTLQGHFAPVVSVAVSPDGKLILTGGEDGVARLWDAATGKPLADLFGNEGQVRHVAFGADGRSIFVVSVWDATRVRRYACTVCRPTAELLTLAKEQAGWRIPAATVVAAK